MKCALCGEKVETHFLGKIKGTYVKNNGKSKAICSLCQQKYKKEEVLAKI